MSYLQAFDVLQLKSKNVSLKDKNMSKELFQLCRNYAVEANKARSLQGDINERNRKNPPKSRSDRPGEWVWFEVYAAPQRDALNKMDEYLKQIAAKFPPAILVLGELPDLILGAKSSNQKIIAQHEFESRIFSRLEFLVDALRTLEDSIKEKGATFQVAEYLKPMLSEQRDFSGITKLDLPLGGFEQEVINLAFVGSKVFSAEHGPVGEIKVQRLLADLDLVSDFYNDPHGVEPGTWRQIVLSQYRDRLDEIVESKKKDTKKWGEYWGYFAKFTALLTLVALMAIFPFGDVAVGSNLALLFTLCGTSSAILGVLTMLNNLFDTLEKSKQLDAAARDKFFRLAQTDPATILEIGEILSQNKALREELLTGSFENILTLGSAHKLKAIAVALNFQALFQDVETLFAPISTDGS
jgi:hypothetical protein